VLAAPPARPYTYTHIHTHTRYSYVRMGQPCLGRSEYYSAFTRSHDTISLHIFSPALLGSLFYLSTFVFLTPGHILTFSGEKTSSRPHYFGEEKGIIDMGSAHFI